MKIQEIKYYFCMVITLVSFNILSCKKPKHIEEEKMNIEETNRKAEILHQLHDPENPLTIVNTWDVGSSSTVEQNERTQVIGTSSWSVAASKGYDDGEKIPKEEALTVIKSIADNTNLPVTADYEAGYARNIRELEKSSEEIILTGVAGINFEDQIIEQEGELYSIEEQSQRISKIKETFTKKGVNIFINARTDLFFRNNEQEHEKLLEEAIKRARAYKESGANGFFVPGLKNLELIKTLTQESPIPVNLMVQNEEEVTKFLGLGVSRFSMGPFPYIAAMGILKNFLKK